MRSFITTMFSSNNSVSWARVTSTIILVFLLGWANIAILKSIDKVDALVKIPWNTFAVFVGSVYGIGKINETIQSLGGK